MNARSLVFFVFVSGSFLRGASHTALEKMNKRWEKIESTAYKGPHFPVSEPLSLFQKTYLLSSSYLTKTFHCWYDFLPKDREKLIHRHGVSVKLKWISVQNDDYTGFFSTGSDTIIGRFSLALPQSESFIPGIALKFFRNQSPSVNIMAMAGLTPLKSHQFFDHDLTTEISKPESSLSNKIMEHAFHKALVKASGIHDGSVFRIPLDLLAQTSSLGNQIDPSNAPWSIIFSPTAEAKKIHQAQFDDFRLMLINGSRIHSHKYIYDIFAQKNGIKNLIGFLKAESDFVASQAGDEMFFQHPTTSQHIQYRCLHRS